MERALYLTKVKNFRRYNGRYGRLYFGQEFCQRLIPGRDELKEAIEFACRYKLQFSLVTPYVTNTGLKKIVALLEVLVERLPRCEVVFNDWGVLNILRRDFRTFVPVLGRLLTKQKRCPTLIKLLQRKNEAFIFPSPDGPLPHIFIQRKLPVDLDMYYKGSNVSTVGRIQRFLLPQGVRRIELDNLGQGMQAQLLKHKVSASVYVPYVYISTTFFCPTAGCSTRLNSSLKIRPCRQECQRYHFILKNPIFPVCLYLKGNTYFYKNNKFHLSLWQGLGVDRIVVSPEIPL